MSKKDTEIRVKAGHDFRDWSRQLSILHRGHWNAARYYDRINFNLGLATVVTAAISGTTAFSQLQQQAQQSSANIWVLLVVGLFALLAAALGALQAFYRSSDLAANHKQSGRKFGQLRRELDQYHIIGFPTDHKELEQFLTSFRERWDAIDDESLPIPRKIYNKAKSFNFSTPQDRKTEIT